MTKELAVVSDKEIQVSPYGTELNEGLKAAGLLKASMNRKAKKIFFNGKEYAEFHDLQVVANYFGHSIRTYDAQPVDIGGIKGFKAHADLISKEGIHIGGAEAYCMQDEPNWARKPLFQLASMAQTRAAAKCITNDYRWVLDLAGYGTTPAEEMPSESDAKSGPVMAPRNTREHPGNTPAVPQGPTPGLFEATFVLSEIKNFTSKKGTNFIRIYDDKLNAYMVFDKNMIVEAQDLMGQEIKISYEDSKFGKTVKALDLANA